MSFVNVEVGHPPDISQQASLVVSEGDYVAFTH